MFSKGTYVQRRHELKKKVGKGLLLFIGNNESPMNFTDNTYTFRQDSSFLYYFGLNKPNLAAIIDIDNDKEIIFGNDFSVDDIVWMGQQPKIKVLAESAGVQLVYPYEALKNYISSALMNKQKVHFLPPYRSDAVILLSELLEMQIPEVAEQISEEFIRAIVAQREIKTDEEVREIEKAVNISVDMHIAAMKHAKPGMTEAEVAAVVHQEALASGGDISFPIIATINGQTLHNHYHGNVINAGQLFLLDAGGQTDMGYAGDLSTTFPVSDSFTQKQKDIHIIVQRAKLHAESILGVGVPFKEIHKQACIELIKGLKELGLMTGNPEEAYESGAHALFFPCGLGHMMGLDVHDMENLGEKWVGYNGDEHETQFGIKSLRLAKPLKEGFVLTIEPGIYFIPELQEMWRGNKINESFLCWGEIEKYHDFGGLRIEDNYLIETGKYKLLGKYIPRSIEDIETLRQGS